MFNSEISIFILILNFGLYSLKDPDISVAVAKLVNRENEVFCLGTVKHPKLVGTPCSCIGEYVRKKFVLFSNETVTVLAKNKEKVEKIYQVSKFVKLDCDRGLVDKRTAINYEGENISNGLVMVEFGLTEIKYSDMAIVNYDAVETLKEMIKEEKICRVYLYNKQSNQLEKHNVTLKDAKECMNDFKCNVQNETTYCLGRKIPFFPYTCAKISDELENEVIKGSPFFCENGFWGEVIANIKNSVLIKTGMEGRKNLSDFTTYAENADRRVNKLLKIADEL